MLWVFWMINHPNISQDLSKSSGGFNYHEVDFVSLDVQGLNCELHESRYVLYIGYLGGADVPSFISFQLQLLFATTAWWKIEGDMTIRASWQLQ